MRRRPPHGAARPVTDALALVRRSIPAGRSVLVRVDSALYYHALVRPACKAGADVSITMQMLPTVRSAIAAIDDAGWTATKYTDAIYNEATDTLGPPGGRCRNPVHRVHLNGQCDQVPCRLVRRIPDLIPP